MPRLLRYSCVCALLMPALWGMGCDNNFSEVAVYCPPETDCVWTCEDGECRLEYAEPRGADPADPEAPAPTPVEPEAPAPAEPEPAPAEPAPAEPEPAPEPEHTAPDACMILCADLDKDAALCLHDGLSALHAECDQVVECETLTEPSDCRACLSALQIETAACAAFGAICR